MKIFSETGDQLHVWGLWGSVNVTSSNPVGMANGYVEKGMVCAFCVTVRRSGHWAWIDSVNLACTGLLALSGFICTQVGPTSKDVSHPQSKMRFPLACKLNTCTPYASSVLRMDQKAGLIQDFFLQATICWWPSIWQAHQGSKLVAKKTFDLMIGAKDRSLMNGKLKAFPVCGAQRLNQPLLYLSFGTENGYHIIYCRSICSSWATNQFHLWFTILERSTHPPSTKKEKKPWTSDMAGPDFFSSWKMASGFLCWALAKVVIFQHL